MKEAIRMKCGSNKIIPNVRVVDRGYSGKFNLQLEIVVKKRFFLSNTKEAILTANVCGACGYVEMHASDYKELWEIYNSTNKSS